MTNAPSPDHLPQAAAAPRPRRLRRALWLALAALLAMALAIGGAAAWLWHTPQGLAWAVAMADRLLPAKIEARNLSGSLAAGFAADELVYEDAGLTVRIERLQAVLAGVRVGRSRDALRVDFDELLAERLLVHVKPTDAPPVGVPDSIASPVAISARRLAVGLFDLRIGGEPAARRLQLRAIDTQAAIGPDGYAVTEGRFSVGAAKAPLHAQITARIGGARPFAVDGHGVITGSLQERPLQAVIRATGSLVDLLLAAQVAPEVPVDGRPPAADTARGHLEARIASFEAPTLRALAVDLDDFDPSAWLAGAPRAQLAVQADLKPQPAEHFTVAGPMTLINRAAGTIDAGRIPVRRAQAHLEITAQTLRLTDIVAELTRGGVRGGFDIGFDRLDAWQARLDFTGVDPAALDTRLRPFRLDGSASLATEGGDLLVVGQARNRAGLPLHAAVDLRASRARVLINTARLTVGRGQATLAGEVELTGRRTTRLAGTVVEFDPALLARGLDARLNGSFQIDGVLAPQPAGSLSFGLADSQILGRPMEGRGNIALAADQQLDVELAIAVRSASLTARGGLGGPGRALMVELTAPQLRDLGLPVAGRLTASARLEGPWRAPQIDARLDAGDLSHGDHRIGTLRAIGTYGGGADGRLSLQASAADHRFRRTPKLSVQTATLRADGRLSEHRIELHAINEEAQPLALAIAGGWRTAQAKVGPQWHGELRSASADARLDLRLLAPVAIRTDFENWHIGPIDLALAGARIEQARIDIEGDVVSTAGRFSGLQPRRLQFQPEVGTAPESAGQPPDRALQPAAQGGAGQAATFHGNWQLRFGALADGNLVIERTAGDFLAGGRPMGLTDLRVSAELRASRLRAEARLAGTQAGRAEARLDAFVEHADNGWRLAQHRPLAAALEVDMPSVALFNALLADAVRANLRIGGSLKGGLQVSGTPAAPVATGAFEGEGLRLAWVEQGVRLDNGRLRASLDGDSIVLDELRFAGLPQVRPADRRAALAYERKNQAEPGFVALRGRLLLRDLAGVLQVQAVRMPFLQRADRWAVASGGANIVFDPRRVQLNGAVRVDAGFVDFTRPALPALSGDVRVLRAALPEPVAREAPIGINFDLGIDLGESFYLRGVGLDTRVEGQLRLRAEGRGAIHATGALEARDGEYEAFGQKLAIERGRVNFHGPLDNPALDVLAVRSGLPVDVGVTVTRTAHDPLIRLWSAEGLPEPEVLSWLVLGRPTIDAELGRDQLALATALAGLLAGGDEGVTTQLAQLLGIDEFGLRVGEVGAAGRLLPRVVVAGPLRAAAPAVTTEFVTIGKRLTDDITISFEQAAVGAESLVQITYQLTRQLSVVARAGTENAVHLVYSIAFE